MRHALKTKDDLEKDGAQPCSGHSPPLLSKRLQRFLFDIRSAYDTAPGASFATRDLLGMGCLFSWQQYRSTLVSGVFQGTGTTPSM